MKNLIDCFLLLAAKESWRVTESFFGKALRKEMYLFLEVFTSQKLMVRGGEWKGLSILALVRN